MVNQSTFDGRCIKLQYNMFVVVNNIVNLLVVYQGFAKNIEILLPTLELYLFFSRQNNIT